MIARINLALRFKDADAKTVREHVTCGDYLSDTCPKFDLILGNPPWGYDFSDGEKAALRRRFITAQGKNVESYDVFIEKALSDLNRDGVLSFVLPEAVLNVKAHRAVRKLLLESSNISFIEYLGDAFAGVQCPSVIMDICNKGKELSTEGLAVRDGKRSFAIGIKREVTEENFSFNITDEEYSILQKMMRGGKARFLLHNADFALGIVTGNNKESVSDIKQPGNEAVFKGSDVEKYRTKAPSNYIVFRPEKFQQVAPEALYRAKEKLFYRFISDRPVFAYDDQKRLSLNSCNIVIPRIEGLSVKYVMAVLNSCAAEFFYARQFASVKVLRSHLESIPIPVATKKQQQKITALVDELIAGCDEARTKAVYNEIDELVFDLFELTKSERQVVKAGRIT